MVKLKDVAVKRNKSVTLAKFVMLIPINLTAVLNEYEGALRAADSTLENIATGLEDTIKKMTDDIHDKNSALAIVLQIQTALVAAFEKKFPASNLHTRIA